MINIYDFDDTIYEGDSSIDFFKFCFKKNKRIIFLLPKIVFCFILYMLKLKEKKEFKETFFSFLKFFKNIDNELEDFWVVNSKKIKSFYKSIKKNDDIIITASPEFLIKPISKKLNFTLIGTNMDKRTGKINGKNCYGQEKLERLKKLNITKCDNFYSDSLSDYPLKNIASNAYIVKKNRLIKWDDYKISFRKKIISLFFDRDFCLFLAIGFINVFNGVWIALFYSQFINNNVFSYVLGFITSMTISYILNSLFNFKKKLSVNSYLKFGINNIPNFVIQIITVVVFLNILNFNKLVSYIISACISVPITFVLVKVNVFNNRVSNDN